MSEKNFARTTEMSTVGAQVFVDLAQLDSMSELLDVIAKLYPHHKGMDVLKKVLNDVYIGIKGYVEKNKDGILCQSDREKWLYMCATGEEYAEAEKEGEDE